VLAERLAEKVPLNLIGRECSGTDDQVDGASRRSEVILAQGSGRIAVAIRVPDSRLRSPAIALKELDG